MSDKENDDYSQRSTLGSGNRTRLSDVDRGEIRKKYKQMLDDFSAGGVEHADVGVDEQIINEALNKADDLFPLVDTPQEAVLDAKVIKQLTSLCRQYAESVSTNLQKFEANEYVEKLAEQLGITSDGSAGVLDFGLEHWAALGQHSLSRKAPFLSYLSGSLDKPDVVIEKKQRAKRQAADKNAGDATKAKVISQEAEGSQADGGKKTLAEKMAESTFKQLVREFKRNSREPLSYFRFVIHPEDFSQTVENMFYVSFLIKEGRAKIFIADDGLPRICPIGKSHTQEEPSEPKQVVVSMTIPDWRALTTSLKITEPMISHEDIKAANQK